MLDNIVFEIYQKYKRKYSDITTIPFAEISSSPPKYFIWYCHEFEQKLNATVYAGFTSQTVYIYKQVEDAKMKLEITVEIPYERRNEYIDFIYEINNVISADGLCSLFVNNNPYELCSYLSIEDAIASSEKINAIIAKYKVVKNQDKGLRELFRDLGVRCFNNLTFAPRESREEITARVSSMYFFASKQAIEKAGYGSMKEKRKKLFISYCHRDKEFVYKITDMLSDRGAALWIDKQDIDVGENILARVLSGIDESNLSIMFFSQATVVSDFAKLELENIMSYMVKHKIKWYPVKLDDVDVDDILACLSNYKYYDFNSNPQVDELLDDILKHIEKNS